MRVAQPRYETHCVDLLLRTVWSHLYVQGGDVRCLVSTAASTFPERPCVDLHGVLADSSSKLEPTDAVLAGHYDKLRGAALNVVWF